MKKQIGLVAVLATASFGIGIIGHATPTHAQAATPLAYELHQLEIGALSGHQVPLTDGVTGCPGADGQNGAGS